MRKNIFFMLTLMLVVFSVAVVPAFAGYDKSDMMLDQADHSLFGATMFTSTGEHSGMPVNKWGNLADENPIYGPGTIYVPYANSTYGIVRCPDIQVGEPGGPYVGLQTSYNHCPGGFDGEQEANLIIQDLFTQVTEGSYGKVLGAQGIAQYLDSLFAYVSNDSATSGGDAIYIDQTLDQDLADLTAGGSQFGIYQQFHQAFDISSTADFVGGASTAGNALPDSDHRNIDQTIIAFLSEESGSSSLNLTPSGVAPGEVISYLGMWFQIGQDQDCPTGPTTAAGSSICHHAEWGGHGTVSATDHTNFNVTAHDP